MDRSLDDIVQERQRSSGRGRRGSGLRRNNDRNNAPRDGVRKSTRDDRNMSLDREWVHDKYDTLDDAPRRNNRNRPTSDYPRDVNSAKLRVENVHYELTEQDLEGLFTRIGPIKRLVLNYDRAGRSTGVCYVTYESVSDAKQAVQEFDGANANGQPIRLSAIPDNSSRGRNAAAPRSLLERITSPDDKEDGSTVRRSNVNGPPPANIDRYIPGQGERSNSPRRRDGRRPGQRRGTRGGRGDRAREPSARDGRPKKTAEQLDAEMEDYWGAGGASAENGDAPAANGTAEVGGDVDMIE